MGPTVPGRRQALCRRCLAPACCLLLLFVAFAGCQCVLNTFTAPSQVRALTAFNLSVFGTGTSGGAGSECACVFQLPDGFVVMGMVFSSIYAQRGLNPVRDDPAVLAGFRAEPGHYLVSYRGTTLIPAQPPPPTGLLTLTVMAPTVAANQVAFKVAMAGEASAGVWRACDPPSAGVLDFAAVGPNYTRTAQFVPDRVVPFGSACAGTGHDARRLLAVGGIPARGNSRFALTFSTGSPNGLAAIWLGVDRSTWGGLTLPLDLQPYGAPGCSGYVNPLRLHILQFDALGDGGLSMPIPNDAALQDATFYAQGAQILAGANPAGALFTDALSIRVY